MSYALNSTVHNTQWVTGHFHLIYGGSVVIMYFAIAYELWPRLTGRPLIAPTLIRLQLWTWFIGMVAPPLAMKAEDGTWRGCINLWRRIANQMHLHYRFQETTLKGRGFTGYTDG